MNQNESYNTPGGFLDGSVYSTRPRRTRAAWFLLAAVVGAAGFWAWRQLATPPRVVHALTCDVTALTGTFGYTVSGFFFDNSGNLQVYSSAGSFVGDGQGNLSGAETDAFSGSVVRAAAYSGTYSVNPNCTGSFTTNSTAVGGPYIYDFVITDGGNGLQIVEADSGTNIAGTGRKQ